MLKTGLIDINTKPIAIGDLITIDSQDFIVNYGAYEVIKDVIVLGVFLQMVTKPKIKLNIFDFIVNGEINTIRGIVKVFDNCI